MAKTTCWVMGVVFIVVGLLGFFNNPVLGIFPVNTLHNLIHLVSGILAIVFAMRGEGSARMFSKWFGWIYLVVAILGFIARPFMANILMIDMADNILHIILAAVFLAAGYMGNRDGAMA